MNKKGTLFNTNIPAISVENYTKRFGNFFVTKNVNFQVGHGLIHGFIGPNGSGKTTVIKAMIGAYIPTKGKIFINGNVAGTINANKSIGYIPEKASFPKHLNSLQYLSQMGQLSGLKSKDAKKKAHSILKSLKLLKHAKRKPISFSSGMQKKILLAQSLLTNPTILILDEPAANLDPTARNDLFNTLIQIKNQGKTIFISSHILAELEKIVNEVTFIYYGEIIFSGSTKVFDEIKSNVCIKSTNNIKLFKILKNQGYKIKGDINIEIVILEITIDEVDKLFHFLASLEITILSFRSNDLQFIYNKLIKKSINEKRGLEIINTPKKTQNKIKKIFKFPIFHSKKR